MEPADLIPKPLIVARYFAKRARPPSTRCEAELARCEQQLTSWRKSTAARTGCWPRLERRRQAEDHRKAVKARLKEIGNDPDYADERASC